MLDDQTALKIVTKLNGPEFCQDPALALDQEQIKECQNFVTSYIPSSLKALFSPRSFVAEDICYDLFNVCDWFLNEYCFYKLESNSRLCTYTI